MKPKFLILILLIGFLAAIAPMRISGQSLRGVGQGAAPRSITLDEAIALARRQSVEAAVALNELKAAYWEYRTYRAELLPEITFNGTLPSYAKQYASYMNEDGNYSFVRTNSLEMAAGISVTQNIWFTGGSLSLNTSLDFMRQLDGAKYNRFMSIPVALTLNQPLFATNRLKWNRKIEPVKYKEAKAKFLSATEEVAMAAINYYFSLLMAMETQGIAQQNLNNALKLYEVAKEKRLIGQISQNDLSQMELNLINAESTLTQAQSEYKSRMFRLRSFLGIEEDEELVPEYPAELSFDGASAEVEYQDALTRALDNNKFAHSIRRQQLEADYEVAKAVGAMREISLFAQVGLTGTGTDMCQAYNPLKDNQIVRIGVAVPLLDWGKRRGQVKVAQSNRQAVESRIRQETQNFSQDLFVLVERFNNQRRQLRLAAKADSITQRRYKANVETFMIGRISTLDLNDSQLAKDEARKAYVDEMYKFWYYLYQLRSLTLWDYASGKGIDADIERVVKE